MELVAALREKLAMAGRMLSLTHGFDAQWLCIKVSLAPRKTSQQGYIKAKYLHNAPYSMSEAGKPEIAKKLAEDLRTIPEEKPTPLVRYYKEHLISDLDVLLH